MRVPMETWYELHGLHAVIEIPRRDDCGKRLGIESVIKRILLDHDKSENNVVDEIGFFSLQHLPDATARAIYN